MAPLGSVCVVVYPDTGPRRHPATDSRIPLASPHLGPPSLPRAPLPSSLFARWHRSNDSGSSSPPRPCSTHPTPRDTTFPRQCWRTHSIANRVSPYCVTENQGLALALLVEGVVMSTGIAGTVRSGIHCMGDAE